MMGIRRGEVIRLRSYETGVVHIGDPVGAFVSEPFTPGSACPKCDFMNVSTDYIEKYSLRSDCTRHRSPNAVPLDEGRDLEVFDEHFHRNCLNCGFIWRQEVEDERKHGFQGFNRESSPETQAVPVEFIDHGPNYDEVANGDYPHPSRWNR